MIPAIPPLLIRSGQNGDVLLFGPFRPGTVVRTMRIGGGCNEGGAAGVQAHYLELIIAACSNKEVNTQAELVASRLLHLPLSTMAGDSGVRLHATSTVHTANDQVSLWDVHLPVEFTATKDVRYLGIMLGSGVTGAGWRGCVALELGDSRPDDEPPTPESV